MFHILPLRCQWGTLYRTILPKKIIFNSVLSHENCSWKITAIWPNIQNLVFPFVSICWKSVANKEHRNGSRLAASRNNCKSPAKVSHDLWTVWVQIKLKSMTAATLTKPCGVGSSAASQCGSYLFKATPHPPPLPLLSWSLGNLCVLWWNICQILHVTPLIVLRISTLPNGYQPNIKGGAPVRKCDETDPNSF